MIYTPRTLAQNLARATQCEEFVPSPLPEAKSVKPWRPAALRPGASAGSAMPHVNKSTRCSDCGHPKGYHCESMMPHFDAEDHVFSCITQHCQCGRCRCWAFTNPYTGAVTAWKRPVEETTPCAKCFHPKNHHCRKGQISIVVDGVPYGCRHFLAWLALHVSTAKIEPCCDSTACAEVDKQKTFCPCSKFISPYARRRTARKKTTAADQPCPPVATAMATGVHS